MASVGILSLEFRARGYHLETLLVQASVVATGLLYFLPRIRKKPDCVPRLLLLYHCPGFYVVVTCVQLPRANVGRLSDII
ncbi:hypothetical protein F4808DRAFT_429423 [Astrocystis sublimbata]|nr:hypothetical protein F4808DRAFT_429423 [Astrocystis sublimbata]